METDDVVTWEDFRKQLARAAEAAEARAKSYGKLVRDFAELNDRELVSLLKDIQHDEVSYAKRLRSAMADMNAGGYGLGLAPPRE